MTTTVAGLFQIFFLLHRIASFFQSAASRFFFSNGCVFMRPFTFMFAATGDLTRGGNVIGWWRRWLERGGGVRRSMKHRIQNPEYRIQKVRKPIKFRLAHASRVGLKTGKMNKEPMKQGRRNGVMEYWSDGREAVAPSGAWNQYGEQGAESRSGHRGARGRARKSLGRSGIRPYRALGGVVRSGQKCVGRRVQLGKGGRGVGKRTGFSHIETALTRLFPRVSTQVVDFPCMCDVRLFCERLKTAESRQWNDWQGNNQAGLGTKMGMGGKWSVGVLESRGAMRKVTHCFAKIHEVSRKCAKVRTDQGRGYAMLRIVTGETNFWPRMHTDLHGFRKDIEQEETENRETRIGEGQSLFRTLAIFGQMCGQSRVRFQH